VNNLSPSKTKVLVEKLKLPVKVLLPMVLFLNCRNLKYPTPSLKAFSRNLNKSLLLGMIKGR